MKAIPFIIGVCLGGFIAVAVVLPATRTEPLYTRAGVGRLEELRLRAVRGDISQAASSLKEVVEYWPAKVRHEGHMSQVYELARAGVIREIITRMRSLGGEDLGDDPKLWIEKFYQKETAQFNQSADMKSGVKRQFPQGEAETKNVLAPQDDVRTFRPLRPPPGAAH